MRVTVAEYKFLCNMSSSSFFLQTNFLKLSEVNNCCIFCRIEEVMLETGFHLGDPPFAYGNIL